MQQQPPSSPGVGLPDVVKDSYLKKASLVDDDGLRHRRHLGDDAPSDDSTPPVSTAPRDVLPVSWRAAALRSLWLVFAAAALVVIPIVAKGRLHAEDSMAGIRWVSASAPVVINMKASKLGYVYVVMTAAPYLAPGRDAGFSSGGGSGGVMTHSPHRRRRLLAAAPSAEWTAADAAALAAAAPRAPLEAPTAAAAHLKRLRVHRRMALAVDGGGTGAPAPLPQQQQQQPQDAAPSPSPPPSSPQIMATLMVRDPEAAAAAAAAANASSCIAPADAGGAAVVPPSALGLVPVTDAQACALRPDAAARCLLAFEPGAAAAAEGKELLLVLSMPVPGAAAVDVRARDLGPLGRAKAWAALAVLLLMLAAIATERIHRMHAAFVAAFAQMGLLLWADMTPTLDTMTSWLDSSTLGLLFGMMIIVGQLQRTGLFEVLCACALRACRGRMWALTLMILYLTGFVSAFLDNVTTMLLMGPISVSTMAACGRDPAPLLIAQALFSNIGGTATMVGDPPNIIIGNALAPAIGFADFLIHLAPGVIAASVPAALVILLMWRRELTGEVPDHASVLAAAKQYTIRDRALLLKAGVVTAAVVAAFLLHPLHHVDPAVFAILGATLLIVAVAPTDAAGPLKPVEWDMLLFFAGQFVMVEAAAELGLIDMVGGWLASAIRAAPPAARTAAAVHILLWGSAVTSAVLDNIPFTVTMVPVVEYLAAAGLGLELKTLAWALAFGACFGGNATLIGASANIVTASVLERGSRHVTFCEWLRAGVPVTVVSLLAANAYMLRYVF